MVPLIFSYKMQYCICFSLKCRENFMRKAANYHITHIIKKLEITEVYNHRKIVK